MQPPQPTTIIVSQVGVVRAEVAPAPPPDGAALVLGELLQGPRTAGDLCKTLRRSKSFIYRILAELQQDGKVEKVKPCLYKMA